MTASFARYRTAIPLSLEKGRSAAGHQWLRPDVAIAVYVPRQPILDVRLRKGPPLNHLGHSQHLPRRQLDRQLATAFPQPGADRCEAGAISRRDVPAR